MKNSLSPKKIRQINADLSVVKMTLHTFTNFCQIFREIRSQCKVLKKCILLINLKVDFTNFYIEKMKRNILGARTQNFSNLLSFVTCKMIRSRVELELSH